MQEVSFQSTYKIPVSQHGISRADKAKLKSLLKNYGNSIIGTGTTGYARVSMTNDLDATFIEKIKNIGYKIYQKFSGENIPRKNLDDYIKDCIDKKEYQEFGKKKNKIPDYAKVSKINYRNLKKDSYNRFNPIEPPKENIEYGIKSSITIEEQERIRKTKSYQDIKKDSEKKQLKLYFSLEESNNI